MTGTSGERCSRCRGRGWKLLTLRRSLTSAGDAGERAPLQRSRTRCLTCQGTGKSPARHDGDRTERKGT